MYYHADVPKHKRTISKILLNKSFLFQNDPHRVIRCFSIHLRCEATMDGVGNFCVLFVIITCFVVVKTAGDMAGIIFRYYFVRHFYYTFVFLPTF